MKRAWCERYLREDPAPGIAVVRGFMYAILQSRMCDRNFAANIAAFGRRTRGKNRLDTGQTFEDEVTDLESMARSVSARQPRHPARPSLETSATAPTSRLPRWWCRKEATCCKIGRAPATALYLAMDGGISRLPPAHARGVSEVKLPFDGTIGGLFVSPPKRALYFLDRMALASAIYTSVRKVASPTPDYAQSPISTSAPTNQARIRDGQGWAKIPYSCYIRRAENGRQRATWISAYGSYALPVHPTLPAAPRAARRRRIVGYANVRAAVNMARMHRAAN